MNLALLLPAALAALAAVLLPLLIHLARRSEQRPTVFAALQWLRQKPKPRHRVRFDEWPLLIARLLLVVLLAVLLARPVLSGAWSRDPWVAVVPGVDVERARALGGAADARWHWLAPGFPALDEALAPEMAPSPRATSTSLLRELDATLPPDVALTVLVPETLDGVDAQRPRLGRRVEWRIVPGAPERDRAIPAVPAPTLSVRYAPEREAALRYLRAAAMAWQPQTAGADPVALDFAAAGAPLPATARPLVWLVPGPVPAPVLEYARGGADVLLDAQARVDDLPGRVPLWRDDAGGVLVEGGAYGRGRLMRLTRSLVPGQMPVLLDAEFPRRLRGLFEPDPPAPARVLAQQHEPDTGGPTFIPAARDLQAWLALAIALVFLLERWLATGARGRAAP
ncbi:BatA domain-containing protein [Cognatilysobacter tabacisoli]|uniref:BatA domain-containing protein n=1 Tax=Cognatilysobacter tabacisoli TaxID=2315424 RepID=UPI000E6B26EB|nr:BatA domain-containing protein [Lysobacter tabacisoli]